MANQNFRVKEGLEVGTGVTISAGIITATNLSVQKVNVSGVSTFNSTTTINGNLGINTTDNGYSLEVNGVSRLRSATIDGNLFIGTIPATGNPGSISVLDGASISLGSSDDLSITHDGSNSYIKDQGTGSLIINSNNLQVKNATNDETGLVFSQDGSVELYHNNTKKFETIGAGATVGGTTFTNQLGVSGISTLRNTIVGGATTELIVNGDARITGILTIGTSSITFNGNDNSVTIGTGVTVFGNVGIISATEFRGNGANLTGVQPFPSGTLMLFQQTASPTGWTKQTTHNDKTLRVVSGSASSGGSTAFTSVFASRTPSGSVSGSNSGGAVSNHTLSESQIPSHVHYADNSNGFGSLFGNWAYSERGSSVDFSNDNYVKATGGSGAHGHGFTNPTWSGTFSGSAMDFAVQYVDLIIASKD